MSEIRQNIITRDWVIFAPERAKRPHEFIDRQVSISLPSYRPDCPFCRGNESLDDTIETLRIGVPDWRVRIVHNKFPALKPKGEHSLLRSGIHNSITGFGYHEVIIEHPHHDRHFAFFKGLSGALSGTFDRSTDRNDRYFQKSWYQSRQIPRASPFPVSGLTDRALSFPDAFRSCYRQCMFCVVLENELEEKERLVLTSGHFIAFVPYAALSPFHIWIFPHRHFSCFSKIEPEELKDLAFVLQQVLAKLYWGLGNPDYNFILRSSPTAETETNYYHWYISIVPRVSRTAGFELGTGMYINTALPDKSAQFLREVEIPTNLE